MTTHTHTLLRKTLNVITLKLKGYGEVLASAKNKIEQNTKSGQVLERKGGV